MRAIICSSWLFCNFHVVNAYCIEEFSMLCHKLSSRIVVDALVEEYAFVFIWLTTSRSTEESIPVRTGQLIRMVLKQQRLNQILNDIRYDDFRYASQSCIHDEQLSSGQLINQSIKLRAVTNPLSNLERRKCTESNWKGRWSLRPVQKPAREAFLPAELTS